MSTSACIKPSLAIKYTAASNSVNYKRKRQDELNIEISPNNKRPIHHHTTTATTAAGRWKWEPLHSTNRDKTVSISTHGYMAATMDQSSPNLESETACSMLSLTIAYWLLTTHSNKNLSEFANNLHDTKATLMPSPPTLDSLLLQGSKAWLQMLQVPEVKALTHEDGLQNFDTTLRYGAPLLQDHHKHRLISLQSKTSYIRKEDSFSCYFNNHESANMVDECMSFDSIWPYVIEAAKSQSKTYVVGWNAHYFVLHVAAGAHAIYIVDTLGCRFSPNCKKAYVLKLDSTSKFCIKSSKSNSATPLTAAEVTKLYLKEFLAGFTVRQAWKDHKKGHLQHDKLLEKLQIDFHSVAI